MIYTDGSKLNNKVGFGFLVIEEDQVIAEFKYRLNDSAKVFNAEVQAIAEAIKYILYSTTGEVTIKSDSISALAAICNCLRTRDPPYAATHREDHQLTLGESTHRRSLQ